MWGRRNSHTLPPFRFGNTPTHVGKTGFVNENSTCVGKHPHACGEDLNQAGIMQPSAETPPRMWGRLDGMSGLAFMKGNTPTHVGKTHFAQNGFVLDQKHPHACGEDYGFQLRPIDAEETPPRMWGRLVYQSDQLTRPRNTPTHVGKTLGGG